jgi:caffeoyl-CoA O-methyltransferase
VAANSRVLDTLAIFERMSHRIVHEISARYARALLDRHDEPVLVEMEELARAEGFPIVNRHAGVTLEILARSLGARRVLELGSGYGYSAYWFARAGATEIHCTDGSQTNAKRAEDYLSRAGYWDRISWHTGDAVTEMDRLDGEFDIIYNDIDKDGYPAAWKAARERVRVGGLYICDNVLWSGLAAEDPPVDDDGPDGWTQAIKDQNSAIASDEDWLSSILPIRDGIIVANRLR